MNDEGQIFVEPQGMCVLAGVGRDNGRARHGARARRSSSCHAARHRPPAARPTGATTPSSARSALSAGLQGERGRLLPQQPVDHAPVPPRRRRSRARVLPARSTRRRARDQRRAPVRAVRLRADDRGQDAATPGEAKNSWLTGTAAWIVRRCDAVDPRIRPEHDGLRIDPCVPASWNGFTALRRFRGRDLRGDGAPI